MTVNNIDLTTILFFAPAGALIPTAAVVQYSDALPGGPVNVLVFPGLDGAFSMYEDDGETTDYENGNSRATYFGWNHIAKNLNWIVRGSFADEHSFTQVTATLMDPQGPVAGSVVPIGFGGSIQF